MFKYNEIYENNIYSNNIGVGLEGSGIAILNNNQYANNTTPKLIENPKDIKVIENHENKKNTRSMIVYVFIFIIIILILKIR